MTPAALLLETLSSMGIRVWVAGDKLRYRTRQGSLPHELKEEIQAHRGELMELLGGPPASIGIRCNTATPPQETPEAVASKPLTADGGVAASRETCRNTWATALEAMAAAWQRYTARCQAAGREPVWLDDESLTERVAAAIRAGDLPGTRAAITAWQAAWNAVIGHDSVVEPVLAHADAPPEPPPGLLAEARRLPAAEAGRIGFSGSPNPSPKPRKR